VGTSRFNYPQPRQQTEVDKRSGSTVGWNIPYPGGYSPTGETGWLARTD